jgi:hypothetical protein
MVSDSSKKLYKPGQKVPQSGIYNVVHAEHRQPHRASFKAQEQFPPCTQCSDKVTFELMLAASDQEDDGKTG